MTHPRINSTRELTKHFIKLVRSFIFVLTNHTINIRYPPADNISPARCPPAGECQWAKLSTIFFDFFFKSPYSNWINQHLFTEKNEMKLLILFKTPFGRSYYNRFLYGKTLKDLKRYILKMTRPWNFHDNFWYTKYETCKLSKKIGIFSQFQIKEYTGTVSIWLK